MTKALLSTLASAFICSASPSGNALTLHEFYAIDANAKTWYLGGVYDTNLIQWRGQGERSACIESIGIQGFLRKVSEFVVALPADPNSTQRRVYDRMNVALIGSMILDEACKK